MKRVIVILIAVAASCLVRPSDCQAVAYAYVANQADGTVSVIQISDNAVIDTIDLETSGPTGVGVTPDGSYVYVTNRGDGTVSVIRTSDNIVLGDPIDVGKKPFGLAVNPVSALVYVTNRADGEVSVVETDTEIDTITVENGPVGVDVTPDGGFVYVANRANNSISVIQTPANTIYTTIRDDIGNKPAGVAVSSDGTYVYVTNRDDGTVSVIRTSDNTVIGLPTEVGAMPFGLALSPNDAYAYVANSDNNTVSVFQTSEHTEIDTIDVGASPFGIAVTPDSERVYVTNSGENTVSVIRTSDNAVIETIVVGGAPTSLGRFIASISAPEAPTDLAATPESDTRNDLSWTDNSFDESGFTIERKGVSDETYAEIDAVDANVTNYSDTGLAPDTAYSYRVRAYNDHGNSDYSNEDKAVILEAPTNLTAHGVSHSRIRLSWTDNSFGESGFRIERMLVSEDTDSGTDAENSDDTTSDNSDDTTSDNSVGTTSETAGDASFQVGANVTSFTDSGLEPYTTYRYRVRAVTDDDESGWSNEVEKRTKDDCFIATAAYGSLMEPHVVTLRHFRDAYLIPHTLGRVFVRTYYQYSPPIAHFISQHETLRAAVRAGLLPLVAFSYSMLHLGLTLTLTIVVFVVLSPVGLHWLCQRKKHSHKSGV
jgi:YVTN family beta-propeller protein